PCVGGCDRSDRPAGGERAVAGGGERAGSAGERLPDGGCARDRGCAGDRDRLGLERADIARRRTRETTLVDPERVPHQQWVDARAAGRDQRTAGGGRKREGADVAGGAGWPGGAAVSAKHARQLRVCTDLVVVGGAQPARRWGRVLQV